MLKRDQSLKIWFWCISPLRFNSSPVKIFFEFFSYSSRPKSFCFRNWWSKRRSVHIYNFRFATGKPIKLLNNTVLLKKNSCFPRSKVFDPQLCGFPGHWETKKPQKCETRRPQVLSAGKVFPSIMRILCFCFSGNLVVTTWLTTVLTSIK